MASLSLGPRFHDMVARTLPSSGWPAGGARSERSRARTARGRLAGETGPAVRRAVPPLMLSALLAAAAPPVAGQTLAGRILDDATSAPVAGALVALLDGDSTRLRAVLSGPGGRYSLRLPDGDAFRLRVQRIGYATTVTPLIRRARAVREPVDVRVPVQAVSLDPIVATGARRCVVDPRTALETATLWEQTRKTLEVTALVHREGLVSFQTVRFRRSLDPDRSVLVEESREEALTSRPFRSLPAERLAATGWVQQEGDTAVYHMPDPEAALSEVFLDGHCFHVDVREGAGGREVGLAFAPVRGGRLADVSGVLWLDGRTGELRSLAYGYTGLVPEEAMEVAGGRAEFERLANGVWVVRRWSISMPVLAERERFLGLLKGVEVVGIREEGGEIVEARDREGRRLTEEGPHEIAGEVRDGDVGRPLEGALVRLSGTHRLWTTGPDGRYRLGGLPRGDYLLTFHHPLLDTLGVRPAAWPLRLPGGPPPPVLETPSRAEVLSQACPGVDPEWTSGVLSGQVVDPATGRGVAHARVEMRFTGPRGRSRTLDVRTDTEGWYRFCAVIPERPLTLRAGDGDRRGPEVTVRVPERGFALAHLRLGG